MFLSFFFFLKFSFVVVFYYPSSRQLKNIIIQNTNHSSSKSSLVVSPKTCAGAAVEEGLSRWRWSGGNIDDGLFVVCFEERSVFLSTRPPLGNRRRKNPSRNFSKRSTRETTVLVATATTTRGLLILILILIRFNRWKTW